MEETAKKHLKRFIKEGDTLYTVLRHVSSSGMSRRISVFSIKDNRPSCLDYDIEQLGLWKRDKNNDGLRIGGSGMDMGFHVVYELAAALFGDGYALKQAWI